MSVDGCDSNDNNIIIIISYISSGGSLDIPRVFPLGVPRGELSIPASSTFDVESQERIFRPDLAPD